MTIIQDLETVIKELTGYEPIEQNWSPDPDRPSQRRYIYFQPFERFGTTPGKFVHCTVGPQHTIDRLLVILTYCRVLNVLGIDPKTVLEEMKC